jgi:hypothetical protein
MYTHAQHTFTHSRTYTKYMQGVSQQGRCIWVSDWELQIDLGSGAEIEPNHQLRFSSGTVGLRTRNSVSEATTAAFNVSRPLTLIVPDISLSGSSVRICMYASVCVFHFCF